MKVRMAVANTKSRVNTNSKVDEQVMKVGVVAIGLASCAIGIWSLACLASGVIASGGPLALVGNWVKAIIG